MPTGSQEELSQKVHELLGTVFQHANEKSGKRGQNGADVIPLANKLFGDLMPGFLENIGADPNDANTHQLQWQMKNLFEQAVMQGGMAPQPKRGLFGRKGSQAADLSRFFRLEEGAISQLVNGFASTPAGPSYSAPSFSPSSSFSPPPQSWSYPPPPPPDFSAASTDPNRFPAPPPSPPPPPAKVANAEELLGRLTEIEKQTLPDASMALHESRSHDAVNALREIDKVLTEASDTLKNGLESPEMRDMLYSVAAQTEVIVYEDVNTRDILRKHGREDGKEIVEKYCDYGTTPKISYSQHPADKAMNTDEFKGVLQGRVSINGEEYRHVFPCSPISAAETLGKILQEDTSLINDSSRKVTPDQMAASQKRVGLIENWLAKEDRIPPVARTFLENAIGGNRTALEAVKDQGLAAGNPHRDAVNDLRFKGAVNYLKEGMQPDAPTPGSRPQSQEPRREGFNR